MEKTFNDKIRWEYLKYEIRSFLSTSVSEARKRNEEINTSENKVKTLEENLANNERNQD